ncbi:hypothetical protein CTM94_10595 [Photobacterium leiognathi]|uniref:Uncharacterized protein n=1 Tax=Photobacterium leiognathi TaxID=553611 RepID=A0ABX5GG04_PHOLE|nr:hypothetical protein UB42_06305 [Photobacterium leiognathi]PSV82229.1 hypothetical protein CTM94_10595 [Photobacterium leiognathi]
MRRQKIELLYEKVVEYYSIRVDFLYPNNIQENELFDSRSYFYSLYSEIVMIIELYFNINNELSDVSLKFSENHNKTIKLATKYTLNKIQPPLDKHEELLKEYTEIYLSLKFYLVQSMRVELGENN